MHSKFFSYPLIIKENHLDMFGHVNNATYLALLEEARWDILTQNGFGLEKILAMGVGPTILEINLRFLKEIRLRQAIVIQTQFTSYEGKIGLISQNILRNDEVCSTAELKIGLFNLKERKLIPPTAEWLKAIGVEDN